VTGGARTWRLLDDLGCAHGAAEQMARDVELLDDVAGGAPPVLRLYRWGRPALSLGRFQPHDDVDSAACDRLGVDVVRRPTGGRAILHGRDLTYAVAMPRPAGAAGSVAAVHDLLAGALVAGLARLGVDAAVARHDADGPTGPVCFTGMQGADLRVGERKLCGSAQVRRRGRVHAVLQHGSILLDRLSFDETAVLHGADVPLAASTVTLAELGAPADARVVARELVEGFRQTLDVDFTVAVEGVEVTRWSSVQALP
jgi:lipoate-protein ligase A